MKGHFFIYVLCLLCYFSPVKAQSKSNFWRNILEKLNESKTDTAYTIRSAYPFRVKARFGTMLDIISLGYDDKTNISLLSEPIFKIGGYISYRNIGVGFQKNIKNLFQGNNNDNIEINASAYGRVFGGDISYVTQTDYSIKSYNNTEWNKDVDGISHKRLYANGYYVFNNKRFSYPAAQTQSYHQKKSCGSAIIGLSLYYNKMKLSSLYKVIEDVPLTHSIKNLSSLCFNLNGGYAYNWVIGQKWMIHGSILPSISIINKTKYESKESSAIKKNNIKIDCLSRVGIIHDSHKTFASFTALMYVNNLCHSPVNITDFHVYTLLSYGIRF